MRCWLTRRRLNRYEDGDLSPKQTAAVEQHLDACPRCPAELAQLRSAITLVESVEQVEPRAQFTAEVLTAIRSRRAAEQPAEPVTWPVGVALGFAGLVVTTALIVGVWTLDLEGIRAAGTAIGASWGPVFDVARSFIVQALQILGTVVEALTQPLLFALVADMVLLMAVLVVWRRIVTARQSAGIGAILA
ncbi:MAG: zf-HC2 domain-containing protein, partial [Armatimonadota bacterium]